MKYFFQVHNILQWFEFFKFLSNSFIYIIQYKNYFRFKKYNININNYKWSQQKIIIKYTILFLTCAHIINKISNIVLSKYYCYSMV